MSDLIFVLLLTLAISFGLLHGALMLVSPETHRRLNFWLASKGGRSSLRLDEQAPKKDSELPYRAVGFIILAGLVTFVSVLIDSLMRGHVLSNPTPRTPIRPQATWLPFVVGVAAVAGGVYIMRRPAVLYRWTSKAAPRLRHDKPSDITGLRRVGLLMGSCLIGFGLFALATGLVMLLH